MKRSLSQVVASAAAAASRRLTRIAEYCAGMLQIARTASASKPQPGGVKRIVDNGLEAITAAVRRSRQWIAARLAGNGLEPTHIAARGLTDNGAGGILQKWMAAAQPLLRRWRAGLVAKSQQARNSIAGAASRFWNSGLVRTIVDRVVAAPAAVRRGYDRGFAESLALGRAATGAAIGRACAKASLASLYQNIAALAFTLLVIAGWQAAVHFDLVNRLFVAAPSEAFGVIVERAASGSLWTTTWDTARRMGLGWGVAICLALTLGTAIGNSRAAQQFLAPTLEFCRPLPASAIIPVAILFFGLSPAMSTFVIAFGSIWPILLASIYGFANVPRELREVASSLEMGRLRYILTIALPSASVDIMAGLRISLALALILTVVTEMQASLPGLGYEIFMAQRTFRSADLYAGLMTLGGFGYLINQALLLVERRLMRWRTA